MMIEESSEQLESDSCDSKVKYQNLSKRRKLFLYVPYTVGILWILCHPIVSILTGEPKCRGIYTDEHMFDLRTLWSDPYPAVQIPKPAMNMALDPPRTMCQLVRDPKMLAIDNIQLFASPSIQCYEHLDLSIAQIIPPMAPVTPTESLIFVYPYTEDWTTSALHVYLLTMMNRLICKPWLTKSIIIVVSNSSHCTLSDAVDVFLNAYHALGSVEPLPYSISSLLIRQLVVVNTELSDYTQQSNEMYVLPHGINGVLPNLDLVAGVKKSLWKSFARVEPSIQVHPFNVSNFIEKVDKMFTRHKWLRNWAHDLVHMFAFMWGSFGRTAPHATALSHGIDSITIIARINASQDPYLQSIFMAQFARAMELLLRGLSNLSERLHHNVNQYILPNGDNFVSFSEYLVPTVLILIPLVVRAMLLILIDIKTFRFNVMFVSIVGAMSMSLIFGLFFSDVQQIILSDISFKKLCLALFYVASVFMVSRSHRSTFHLIATNDTLDGMYKEKQRAVQLVTCLISIYIHVPIALFHHSLAIISAVLLVPITAFPTYGSRSQFLKGCLFVFLSFPLSVMGWLSRDTTLLCPLAYQYTIFVPLYFLLGILCIGE